MRQIHEVHAIVAVLVALAATPATPQERATASGSGSASSTLDDVVRDALRLRDAGNPAAAALGLEGFLASHPDAGEAHLLLGNLRRDLATTKTGEAATSDYQTAAKHYRKAFDLTTDPSLRRSILWALIMSYRGAHRLADAERFARQLVDEHGSSGAEVHELLVSTQRAAGQADAATEVFRRAQKALAASPEGLARLALYIVNHVQASPGLSSGSTRTLLDQALLIVDGSLAARPDEVDSLRLKSAVLDLQAKRVESDEKRRASLREESGRLFDRASKLNAEARSPDAPGTATAKVPGECADLDAVVFLPAGESVSVNHAEKVARNQKVLAKYPDCAMAHFLLGQAHAGLADEIGDGGAESRTDRTRHLELAATHIRKAIEVAPESERLPGHLLALVEVLGPAKLNRPAQAEAPIRAAIRRYPENHRFRYLLVSVLLASGRPDEASSVLGEARRASPATAKARAAMGAELWNIVYHDPKLPRADAGKLLAEALIVLEEALKLAPDSYETITYKSLVLRAQATRVEQDPGRIDALRAEADRLVAVAKGLRARNRP